MVFFVLISKLPLLEIKSPADLVKQNQMTLGLGLVLYCVIAGLIIWKKIPLDKWLSFIPDKKYLIGIVILDLVLYFMLYRFDHGFMPPFSIESLPPPPPVRKRLVPPNQKMSNKSRKVSPQKKHPQPPQVKRPTKPREIQKPIEMEDDISSLSTHLHDDLDSSLKHPIQPPPEEASFGGQEYFEDKNKAVIENWDLDEFTQEEYVPDQSEIDQADNIEDEVILER